MEKQLIESRLSDLKQDLVVLEVQHQAAVKRCIEVDNTIETIYSDIRWTMITMVLMVVSALILHINGMSAVVVLWVLTVFEVVLAVVGSLHMLNLKRHYKKKEYADVHEYVCVDRIVYVQSEIVEAESELAKLSTIAE